MTCPKHQRSHLGSTVHPRYATYEPRFFRLGTTPHRHALSRRSRASLRPLKTTSRTPPCTARRVGVHKAMDHSLAQMQSRMRSCDRRTPSTVKTCTHTAHGPAMAGWAPMGTVGWRWPTTRRAGAAPAGAVQAAAARLAGPRRAAPLRAFGEAREAKLTFLATRAEALFWHAYE